MTGMFERLKDIVTGKQKRLELVETITEKIDSFLAKYFPKKTNTTIRIMEVSAIANEFEIIKTLVLEVKYLDYNEEEHIKQLLENLSHVYFENIPKLRKDYPLPERDVSGLINSLTMIKHIVVNELENKHKDISSAYESIRLQAVHILETYFHKSNGNKIAAMILTDLITDLGILQKKIVHLKEITKKSPQEYERKLTQMNNILHVLNELFTEGKREGVYYKFDDRRQIVDKLEFLIEIAKI